MGKKLRVHINNSRARDALYQITPGQWQGPVPSGYGVHLVYVSERTEGRRPDLADVREAVRR